VRAASPGDRAALMPRASFHPYRLHSLALSSSAARIAARCTASVLLPSRLRSLRARQASVCLLFLGSRCARRVVMASAAALGPYSRALALGCKGEELVHRGHNERSDDKFREALAAARAVGTEDCLVTAYLTVSVVDRDLQLLLVRLFKELPLAPPDLLSVANKVREFADEAITGAVAVARRRRTAGTHQPAEQAWYEAHVAAGIAGTSESEKILHWASLSSETAASAACALLNVLAGAKMWALFGESELCSRLDAACDLVDEAVALAGPQRVKGTYSAYEAVMKDRLRNGAELWRQQSSTAAHAERLAEALKQLCLHGLIKADDQAMVAKMTEDMSARQAASRAAASAPELRRRCALASCGAKEAHVSHFSKCGACKAVVYCSKDCQLADWPAHKKACKTAHKAANQAKTAAASNAAQ
jgi:hypothetical protein